MRRTAKSYTDTKQAGKDYVEQHGQYKCREWGIVWVQGTGRRGAMREMMFWACTLLLIVSWRNCGKTLKATETSSLGAGLVRWQWCMSATRGPLCSSPRRWPRDFRRNWLRIQHLWGPAVGQPSRGKRAWWCVPQRPEGSGLPLGAPGLRVSACSRDCLLSSQSGQCGDNLLGVSIAA